MKIAYFDCFSGISGNMILGALMDAGLNVKEFKKRLQSLKLTAYSLQLLSMGMSNDFEVAIEEGSNMIRIGRAVFK